jgi:hypothetical protein
LIDFLAKTELVVSVMHTKKADKECNQNTDNLESSKTARQNAAAHYLDKKDMRVVSYVLKQNLKCVNLNENDKMMARKRGHLRMHPPQARRESGSGSGGSKTKGGGDGLARARPESNTEACGGGEWDGSRAKGDSNGWSGRSEEVDDGWGGIKRKQTREEG